jgi:glycosyltransferase involved in cell wall biosynthesis
VVICNSLRTKHDLVERLGLPDARVHVVYYGSDPVALSPVTAEERAAARRAWGWSLDRPLVGFVGALGDRRKAFDTAFTAWSALCGRAAWDADLIVVGGGAELDAWKARARASGLHERMRFLGFRADVPDVLKALDAVVHPARYEPYGLSPHEALCRGLPALVTASAGIAELYPSTLHDLLLEDPNDAGELEARLWQWRLQIERYRDFTAPFSRSLRARSWDAMAAEIASLVERAA